MTVRNFSNLKPEIHQILDEVSNTLKEVKKVTIAMREMAIDMMKSEKFERRISFRVLFGQLSKIR